MNRTNITWAVILVIVIAIFLLKPWNCAMAGNKSADLKTANDTLLLAKIDALNKKIEDCGKKYLHRHVYVKPPIVYIPNPDQNSQTPTPNTNLRVAPPSSTQSIVTANDIPADIINTYCGQNNYMIFSVQLNGNDGNYWPQIAEDRDKITYNNSVDNPTKDGKNLKFYISEFVDQPNGQVCVTKDGSICIPEKFVANYLGPDKIIKIIIWTGKNTGFHQMSLSGDYYIYKR